MNKEFQKKWVAALRSGDYKQCRGKLKKNGGFCCLGVARHLIDPRSRKQEVGENILCPDHAAMIGLTYNDQIDLAILNDDGFSFKEISYLIENL